MKQFSIFNDYRFSFPLNSYSSHLHIKCRWWRCWWFCGSENILTQLSSPMLLLILSGQWAVKLSRETRIYTKTEAEQTLLGPRTYLWHSLDSKTCLRKQIYRISISLFRAIVLSYVSSERNWNWLEFRTIQHFRLGRLWRLINLFTQIQIHLLCTRIIKDWIEMQIILCNRNFSFLLQSKKIFFPISDFHNSQSWAESLNASFSGVKMARDPIITNCSHHPTSTTIHPSTIS